MILYILLIITTWILIDQVSHFVNENSKRFHYWFKFEFLYNISKQWRGFTYIFRHPYYRYRLHKRFRKQFYDPWECVNLILHMNFELLSEFYVHGGMEHIDYNSYEGDINFRNEIDELYIWWNADRPRIQNEIEELLHTWSEHSICWRERIDNNFSRHLHRESTYGRYVFKMLSDLETELLKQEEENLIRLVKIRNYMWT